MLYSVPGFPPSLSFIVPIDRHTPRFTDVLSVAGPTAPLIIKVLITSLSHGRPGQFTTSA